MKVLLEDGWYVQFTRNRPRIVLIARTTGAAAEMRLRLKCGFSTLQPMHAYEVRPRKDHRGVDLISYVLPFGRLCYGEPDGNRQLQSALAMRMASLAAIR